MTSTPASPADPLLGLPQHVLRDLASVDFHAGAGTPCHRSSLDQLCPCQGNDVVGDFAFRFLTGQAQLSTDTAGRAMKVLAVPPTTAMPRVVTLGLVEGTDVLAGIVVHGIVEHLPCPDNDCRRPEPHQVGVPRPTGMVVLGHERLGDTPVVELLARHVTHLVAQAPAFQRDEQGEQDGRS